MKLYENARSQRSTGGNHKAAAERRHEPAATLWPVSAAFLFFLKRQFFTLAAHQGVQHQRIAI
jgi:hypothetical protein